MDNRKAKRPRSTTPTKGDGQASPKKKSKSNKKSKKKGRNRANSESEKKHAASALDSTATADGQMMAQMLSTFSKLEQSRFEAFRRSTVPSDAVQEWLAACLSDRYRHSSVDKQQQQQRSSSLLLSDLVQTGQADPITSVVATLAKVYAQRLVSTARSIADNETAAANGSNGTNANGDVYSYGAEQQQQQQTSPLSPLHIWQALQERKTQGLEPGFFLQANSGLQWSVVESVHDGRRLAALQAQEDHAAAAAAAAMVLAKSEKEEGTVTVAVAVASKDDDAMEVEVTA